VPGHRYRRGPQSDFGRRVSQGVSRSAAERKCPECGRHGALVSAEPAQDPEDRPGFIQVGIVCRWARDSNGRLCANPGEFRTRRLFPWEG
jgi:hypothetical protein